MANINWKFISFNWKFISIMIAVLLLILAIFYVFKNYVQPKMDPDYVANREYVPGDQREDVTEYIDVLMFTVDWCPHCKKAKPVWNEFAGTYDQKVVNGYKINVKTINCTNDEDTEVKNMVDKYDIEGFPTIILIINNQTIAFDAEATTENLEQFVDNVLS